MTPRLWQPLPRALWLLIFAYTALSLAYSFAQPPFEPSDEQYQFGYVRYLIENRALPVARAGELSGYHHPPLQFALAALLAWPFPSADFPEYETRINPYARFRHWEPSVDNKNLYLHGPWDAWPFQNTALAVRVARLTSLVAGLVTVVLTYQLARALFGEAAALAAAGFVAFMPMFTSLSGALQNDLGAAALGAVTLWLGAHWAQAGFTVRRAVLLGGVIGLGILMKLTAAFLAPPVALLILVWGQREGGLKRAVGLLAAVTFGAALVSGWWFARNLALYGDPTAVNINLENFGGRTSVAEGLALWPEMLPYAWTTFWGRIGHGGIVLYDWMYQALAALTIAALIGLLRVQTHRSAPTEHAARITLLPLPSTLLPLTVLSCFVGLLYYITVSPTGANGRYVYPALPAYMSLLAWGLLNFMPEHWRMNAARAITGVMFAFSASVLAFYVWPAYAPPPALAQLPAEAAPLDANLGNTVKLRGYQVSSDAARPNDRVYLTLYWEPLSLTDRPYSVYVHLLDTNGQIIAQRDTYPGLGRYPTTAWTPGRLFADTYLLFIPEDAPASSAQWTAGLWQAESGDYAFLLDAAGEPIDSGVRFGEFQVRP
jgi:4-amino-4-deoxy-L-arabinose transferase-like glycosyltransferase